MGASVVASLDDAICTIMGNFCLRAGMVTADQQGKKSTDWSEVRGTPEMETRWLSQKLEMAKFSVFFPFLYLLPS
jgi:hypothetical protein